MKKSLKAHRDECIAKLRQSRGTLGTILRITFCNRLNRYRHRANGRTVRNGKWVCNHIWCPHCRKVRMDARTEKYVPLLAQCPHVATVTLLFQPHDHLIFGEDSGRAAKAAIDRHRKSFSRLLERHCDEYLQAGGIEFEYVSREACGPHKHAFIESFDSPWGEDGGCFISHAHFALAAWRGGNELSIGDLRQILHAEYDRDYQVTISPPLRVHRGRPITVEEALTGWCRYSMMSPVDVPAHRLAELRAFDSAMSKRVYNFNRTSARFRPPRQRER